MITLAEGATVYGSDGGGKVPATPSLSSSARKQGGKVLATPSLPSSARSAVRSSPRIEAAKEAAAKKCKTTKNTNTTTNHRRTSTTTKNLPRFRPPGLPPLPPSSAVDPDEESQQSLSQPLLSPPPPVALVGTDGGRRIESQITLPSALGASFSDDDDDDNADDNANANAGSNNGPNFFDNNHADFDDEEDNDVVPNHDVRNHDEDEDDSGVNGMHGFSSGDEFSINERCSYYMDRATITSSNRQAVEFCYMIEADTLCRGANTMKLTELKNAIFERYRALIRDIPAARFGEFGLQEKMIVKIFNAKAQNGSASGHYNKTVEVKAKVQAIVRQIPTLPKLPSGRDILDVRDDFIFQEYKKEMGEVSIILSVSLQLCCF